MICIYSRTIRYYFVWFYSLGITVVIPLALYHIIIESEVISYLSFLLLIILSIVSFIATRFLIRYRIKNIPIHKERVQMVRKEKVEDYHYGGVRCITYAQTFEFPNGSKEIVKIPVLLFILHENVGRIAENDIGLLLYEEQKNKRFFVGFEGEDGTDFYAKEYYKYVVLSENRALI